MHSVFYSPRSLEFHYYREYHGGKGGNLEDNKFRYLIWYPRSALSEDNRLLPNLGFIIQSPNQESVSSIAKAHDHARHMNVIRNREPK